MKSHMLFTKSLSEDFPDCRSFGHNCHFCLDKDISSVFLSTLSYVCSLCNVNDLGFFPLHQLKSLQIFMGVFEFSFIREWSFVVFLSSLCLQQFKNSGGVSGLFFFFFFILVMVGCLRARKFQMCFGFLKVGEIIAIVSSVGDIKTWRWIRGERC